MPVRSSLARILLAVLAASLVASCGGDDSGDDDAPGGGKTDPIALVADLLKSKPPAPKGNTLGAVTSGTNLGNGEVLAELTVNFSGGPPRYVAQLTVYRSEVKAAEVEDLVATFLDASPSTKESRLLCFRSDVPTAVDDGPTVGCVTHVGLTLALFETGPTNATAPDDAMLDWMRRMVTYLEDAAPRASKPINPVPPEALLAILKVTPPPPIPRAHPYNQKPEVLPAGPNDERFLADVWWLAEDQWHVMFGVYMASPDASAAANASHRAEAKRASSPAGAHCYLIPGNFTYLYCEAAESEVFITVSRPAEKTDEVLDAALLSFLDATMQQIRTFRSGKLPALPPASKSSPAATTTPPPTQPGRTAPPATRTVLPPQLTAINAGTWTFEVVVTSNTCPGLAVPAGTEATLEYEFTDSNGDGVIANGEALRIEQTLPGQRDLGSFRMRLPSFEFSYPVTSGQLRGTGYLTIAFNAPDRAEVHYVEDFGSCKLEAE